MAVGDLHQNITTWLESLPPTGSVSALGSQNHRRRAAPLAASNRKRKRSTSAAMQPDTPPSSHASARFTTLPAPGFARRGADRATGQEAPTSPTSPVKRRKTHRDAPSDTRTTSDAAAGDVADATEETLVELMDLEETPRVMQHRPVFRAPAGKGKKERSPSPGAAIASTADLRRLEKPVVIVDGVTGFRTLSSDVQDFYKSIRRLGHLVHFIPAAIHDEFIDVLQSQDTDEDVMPTWFAPPTAQHDTDTDTYASEKQHLAKELDLLVNVHYDALESSTLERHEAAWNSAVHYPLLRLAFDDHLVKANQHQQHSEPHPQPRIRVENVTSATITGDCTPRLSFGRPPVKAGDPYTNDDAASVGVWSVTTSSSSTAGDSLGGVDLDDRDPFSSNASTSQQQRWPLKRQHSTPHLDAKAHSRFGSKKVDFALVLAPLDNTPLHKAIQTVRSRLQQSLLVSQTINPSKYPPLVDAPIAVAIETKTTSATMNPVVQLGLMAAAMHRRLHTLPVRNATGSHPVSETAMLPSIPLIAVVNHQWDIYFACDRGNEIVCGSLPCICGDGFAPNVTYANILDTM
ncbi:hypothetical protein BD289DRAFT_439843 [Coniella lustricola]|uniref:PD-(D/E)XK nuclease-like domain-containing protein n=1 Tax=Coniella lustricola TaxID=2025994 RepID=A0A2T3A151_9PEZI|nr:hypothetical protein BD289DRAFT_439843 [Coniella lustricola]